MPAELRNSYVGNTEESKRFRTYIRIYNNIFAFTSLGVSYDKDLARRNHGIYTFRVQEQMYHSIDDLFPTNQKAKNLQLYFYDNDNELANKMACSNRIDESIVRNLMELLGNNPYSIFLRSLTNVPNLPNFYIALKCDTGLDQGIYITSILHQKLLQYGLKKIVVMLFEHLIPEFTLIVTGHN